MTRLVQIKLLHTAIWFFFASCIVAIPVSGALHHYVWAAVLIGLALIEWRTPSSRASMGGCAMNA
ncbi:MAG: hypothetical protein JWL71_3375 [Acidobacteria bacterium]|nr:hypothetical protein [Acidobacteriota bacterium]